MQTLLISQNTLNMSLPYLAKYLAAPFVANSADVRVFLRHRVKILPAVRFTLTSRYIVFT